MLQNAVSLALLAMFLTLFETNRYVVCTLGSSTSSYNAYADQRPTGDAMQLAGRVSAALAPVCSPNCSGIVLFRNASAPNSILLYEAGRAKMAYSPQFFTVIYEKYGDGAIIGIIAHMLGHAIDAAAPAGWMKSSWTPELRADAWAGCAFANSNLSLTGLGAALIVLSMYPSPSHPGWPVRLSALRLGYIHCGGDGSKFDSRANIVKQLP